MEINGDMFCNNILKNVNLVENYRVKREEIINVLFEVFDKRFVLMEKDFVLKVVVILLEIDEYLRIREELVLFGVE